MWENSSFKFHKTQSDSDEFIINLYSDSAAVAAWKITNK